MRSRYRPLKTNLKTFVIATIFRERERDGHFINIKRVSTKITKFKIEGYLQTKSSVFIYGVIL